MMHLHLSTLVLGVLFAAPVEPEKPEVRSAPSAEVQDLVLLHEEGPLRIRLRISNGEKSVFAAWHDHMDRWFRFADRNRNNVIDAEEIDRVPTVLQMQYLLQSGQVLAVQPVGGNPNANKPTTVADLDTDGDGKVDRHEYFNHYLFTTAGPLIVQAGYVQYGGYGLINSAVSDSLFRTLDINRDGRLSPEEIGKAGELLTRFDTNDDEIISTQEISGNQQFGYPGGYVPGRTAGFGLNLVPVPREVSEVRVTARLRFAREMLTRLDSDRNSRLDGAEFRIPAADFAACDTDGDKTLDALELVKWLVGAPQLTVHVRMERLLEGDSPIEVQGEQVERGKATADGLSFRRLDATFQFDRNNTARNPAYNPGASMKTYLVQIFNTIDREKTGRISLEEINKNQQAAFLRQQTKWLDMDADGFVTLKEIDDYFQLTSAGVGSQLAIGFLDQGRGLFEILDTQADNNLSIGELRKAPQTLRGYLKTGQDSLARTDIPRRYHLMVANTFGGAIQMRMQGQMPAQMMRPGVQPGQGTANRRGPGWFQKMDVNGDNYISPREFLGPPTAFRKLDTDGDGLISDGEATELEKKQPTQPEGRRAESIREAPAERE